MVTGFVGLSTQTMHKSVIAASLFLCDYDANIITLNKDTIAMTKTRDMMLYFTKAESIEVLCGLQDCGAQGDAYREVALVC